MALALLERSCLLYSGENDETTTAINDYGNANQWYYLGDYSMCLFRDEEGAT